MQLGVPFSSADRGKIPPGTIVRRGGDTAMVIEDFAPQSGEEKIVNSGGLTYGCLGRIKAFTPLYIPPKPTQVGDVVTMAEWPIKCPVGSVATNFNRGELFYLLVEGGRFVEYYHTGRPSSYDPIKCSNYPGFRLRILYINKESS